MRPTVPSGDWLPNNLFAEVARRREATRRFLANKGAAAIARAREVLGGRRRATTLPPRVKLKPDRRQHRLTLLSCESCGNDDPRVILRTDDVLYVGCDHCRTVWPVPKPVQPSSLQRSFTPGGGGT